MTQTTAVPTFGQAVGEAQTALRAVIVDVLQEAGTTFERCGLLNTLATRGVAVARDELLRELAHGVQTDTMTISTSSTGSPRVSSARPTARGPMAARSSS